MIIITSHAALISGKIYDALTNNLIENLIYQEKDFIFIRHFINGEKGSEIYIYSKGKIIKKSKMFVISKISILRYLTEIISTFFYILFNKKNNITYIGIDPLNSYTGFLLKKIGKLKMNIFYTPDYSPKRFSNNIVNKIYHFIDKICVLNSDEVWNVSSRIHDVRKKMGLIDEKNIILPNIPLINLNDFKSLQKNKFHLVTLGIISNQLDFYGIFNSIKLLKNKYPQILLKIIGNGPNENEYKKYILDNGLQNNVIFLGYLDHNEALQEISKSGVGLALYNGKWGFNYYGDSVKCREFFSLGLPVLTTDTHSTVNHIIEYKSGIISEINYLNYIDSLEKIFDNYEKYSYNSSILGEKYKNFYFEKIMNLC